MGIEVVDQAKFMRDLHAIFERGDVVGPLIQAIYGHGKDWRGRLRAIKRYYGERRPDIDKEAAHVWAFDVYEVDWPRLFTPIEAAIWQDIRMEAAVLYPQLPVAGFFVDFGNPAAKVALECDGAEFHDWRKDRERDAELAMHGWHVYRLTGSDCKRPDVYREDEDGVEHYDPGPARQLIRQIARTHRISPKWAA